MAKSDLQVAIIGSGFAGLGMGIALRQRGEERFAIFEQAKGLGGTWRDNHYPGAGCDVPSPLYSFSFEPNPEWSRLYSGQAEILAYLEHCARKYGLMPHLRFGAGLAHAAFDEAQGHWVLELTTGQRVTAKVLVSGMGGLSRPAIPDLKGLSSFAGPVFHSAQWRHDVPLDGKTVAVVGTGASAIQFVPRLQPLVKKLVLFQRTPPWILPKADREHGPLERALYRRLPAAQAALRRKIFWQHELRYFGLQNERLSALGERLARAHLRRQVKDPALRARLTPDYRLGCKRVLLSNDYFPAVASPNVELVTEGIDAVTPTGVRTRDGREHAVDAIVLGTGFRATDLFTPLTIRGLGGVDLNDAWRGGLEAYRGTTVAGFPNFFMVVGPNTGLGHNSMILMIEAQLRYVLGALDALEQRQLAWLDVTPAAQATYNAQLQARLGKSVWASGCSSWYQDASGRNTTLWPGTTLEFSRLLARFDVEAYAQKARPLALVRPPARAAAGGGALMSLPGAVVVVSGAASGIGRALAQLASSRGATVALSDVNAAGLEETRASLSGPAFAQVVDVAQRAQVEAFAAEVLRRFGRADVVVSNAGVTVSQRTADLTYEDLEWLMGINFWGVVHQVKAFLPHLLAQRRGTLVNVSSLFGLIGWPSQSAYCASKFAVRGFTEALRLELDGTGVKALCVHPGGVATNIVNSARFYVDDRGRPSKAKMQRDFGKVARTTPQAAATQILDAVARGDERLLVGPDARALDRLQRWVPTHYFKVVRALERLVRGR